MTDYGADDPRSKLDSGPAVAPRRAGPARYTRFNETEPSERDALGRTWYVRGHNFVLAYSEVVPGWSAQRIDQPDEYIVLLLSPGSLAHVDAGDESITAAGARLVVVPPGNSRIQVGSTGVVIRLFSVVADDLTGRSINADAYSEPHATVAPFVPWPASPAGDAIRSYSLDVPPEDGRFGRIFRCSTLMVNVLDPSHGPRDPSMLSPHSHDDFEQGSLATSGEFVHHIRWPWTSDIADWRPDEHEHCPAPSIAIIPPPAIHTSQAVGPGVNQLIDIFCPPRLDFSRQPGWVLNHDDYPLP